MVLQAPPRLGILLINRFVYPPQRRLCTDTALHIQASWRTSVRWPVIAAAAAIAGPIRWVLAFLPWRPSKLRFEVEAMRSPCIALSSFIDMHIEQPASRHWKPASGKTRS